jgi:Leucine-rich repeat (LRR) protein
MQYCILLLTFYICCSCQQAKTAPFEEATLSSTSEDTLTVLDKNILEIHSVMHKELVDELYLNTVSKLPGDSSFFGQAQVNALEAGSQKSLRKVYQRIITPQKPNALENTKHLDLSDQDIHYIPNKVALYSNLRFLSLKNNQIQAINPKLSHCKKLKKLDLSSNGIKKIPFGLIYLTQIEELVLADNNLTSLPSYFYNLNNLKKLDLSNPHSAMATYRNEITHLPKVLLRMQNIEKLFLDNLPLDGLPHDIKKMSNLMVISLKGNNKLNLNQVFNSLGKMNNLIALDLSFIGRRTLPKNISKLKNLKVLVWHENNHMNRAFVLKTLKQLLPNTKIYFGEKGVATPFLRGNSIATIKNAGY